MSKSPTHAAEPPVSPPLNTSQQFGDEGHDLYILATRALWAGDFDQCLKWLREVLELHDLWNQTSNTDPFEDPVGHSAFRLRRQVQRRRTEFRRLREAAEIQPSLLQDQPHVLESEPTHLRGTVWRTDLRYFQLRGYVANVQWDTAFYAAVERLATPRMDNTLNPNYHIVEGAPQALSPDAIAAHTESVLAYDRSWAIEGDLFIDVKFSDFATFQADSQWTQIQLPENSDIIYARFKKILDSLDSLS